MDATPRAAVVLREARATATTQHRLSPGVALTRAAVVRGVVAVGAAGQPRTATAPRVATVEPQTRRRPSAQAQPAARVRWVPPDPVKTVLRVPRVVKCSRVTVVVAAAACAVVDQTTEATEATAVYRRVVAVPAAAAAALTGLCDVGAGDGAHRRWQ
jgi:hypothetical protein